MFLKRYYGVIFASALMMALFSGCGGSAGPKSYANAAPSAAPSYAVSSSEAAAYQETAYNDIAFEEEPVAETRESDAGFSNGESGMAETETQAALENRKIIKHSTLTLETKEFDKALSELIQTVNAAGGYVESQNVDGRSLNYEGDYYQRNAEISARVPAEKLGEVTAKVGELCNIVSKNERMEDITDHYFDAQAHLKSLQLQEERLLDILGKAEKLEEVITLEKALSDVRYEIEALTAAVKRMDSQVTYSYLNLYLQEVAEYQPVTTAPVSFGERISVTFQRSMRTVVSSLQGFVLFMVEVGPLLLVWGVLIGAFVLVVVLAARKLSHPDKKSRNQTPPKPPEGTRGDTKENVEK